MKQKQPITKSQAAVLLAKAIVKHWHSCPIDDKLFEENRCPNCEGWGGEKCQACLIRNAEHIV